jgi:hypothetical protein
MHIKFLSRPKGKKPLRRLRCRLEYNNRIDMKEIRCERMDWINLSQDKGQWWALVNTVMNLPVPHKAGSFFDQLSDD